MIVRKVRLKAKPRDPLHDSTMNARDNEKVRKAVDRRERAESRMIRSIHAWEKARDYERALFKRLDRQEIGGGLDVRKLMDPV